MNTHDYIIVGAGSAGCVLVNPLIANPASKVLLLEVGASDWNPLIRKPAGTVRLTTDERCNLQFHFVPALPDDHGRRTCLLTNPGKKCRSAPCAR